MREDIDGFFSSIAGRYDLLNTVLSCNIDASWRRKAVRRLPCHPGTQVLDLCCGTGKMILEIRRQHGTAVSVTGLDRNREMLSVAHRRLQGCPYVRLLEGDAFALPFAADTFDAVTIAFGLRNLRPPERALWEIKRVLKPGGRLVCLELSPPEPSPFGRLYGIFLNRILPHIGAMGTGDGQAYRYLRDSINGFADKQALLCLMQRAGFLRIDLQPLTQGIACLHVGQKPKLPSH